MLYFISDAGDCFCEAAAIQLKAQSNHQAATDLVDAGNCYKKSSPQSKFFFITSDKLNVFSSYHTDRVEHYTRIDRKAEKIKVDLPFATDPKYPKSIGVLIC